MKHSKINGVWYRLAEDAEGDQYVLREDPLRPPNATVVQGDTSDTFQLRPDQLLWTWTDWSGGEGQLKFDPGQPNRARLLQGVDPFSRPGELQVGPLESWAQQSVGGNWDNYPVQMVEAVGTMYGYHEAAHQFFEWDKTNEYWLPQETPTISINGVNYTAIVGTSDAFFLVGSVSPRDNTLYRYDDTTWTTHNDQFTGGSAGATALGNYVYIWQPIEGLMFELSISTANTGTPETELYSFDGGDLLPDSRCVVNGGGKIYAYSVHGNTTKIHEIIPTTAAGSGYGRELAQMEGIVGEALWWHAGVLYLLARDKRFIPSDGSDELGRKRFVMYVDTEGSYGTLGGVRNFDETNGRPPVAYGVTAGTFGVSGRFGMTAFAVPPTWEEEAQTGAATFGLWEVDAITGGIAAVGRAPTDNDEPGYIGNLIYFDGKYFLCTSGKMVVWDPSQFTLQEGIAISPVIDFGIAGEKILEKIEVACAPLPHNDAYIKAGYRLDGGSWVDAEIVGDATDVGGSLVISTDSTTKTFRTMEVRLKIKGQAVTASPRVLNLNVYARVNRRIKTWDLLLDCSDDAAPQGFNGAKIIENILAIGQSTVVAYTDRYRTHNPEDPGTEYDVVLDSAELYMSQEGEGIVRVRLIEVG